MRIPSNHCPRTLGRYTASVLLHWCVQKYHDEPRQYKSYLKSALTSRPQFVHRIGTSISTGDANCVNACNTTRRRILHELLIVTALETSASHRDHLSLALLVAHAVSPPTWNQRSSTFQSRKEGDQSRTLRPVAAVGASAHANVSASPSIPKRNPSSPEVASVTDAPLPPALELGAGTVKLGQAAAGKGERRRAPGRHGGRDSGVRGRRRHGVRRAARWGRPQGPLT